MILDKIWYDELDLDEHILCIGCVETLLGRELTPVDFNEYPVNHDLSQKRSPRLNNRLGR